LLVPKRSRTPAEQTRSRPLGSFTRGHRLLPLCVLDLHDLGFLAARWRARDVEGEFAAPVALGRGDHPLRELGAILRTDTIARLRQGLALRVEAPFKDGQVRAHRVNPRADVLLLDRVVAELATAFELHPAEVRLEDRAHPEAAWEHRVDLDALGDHRLRLGPVRVRLDRRVPGALVGRDDLVLGRW